MKFYYNSDFFEEKVIVVVGDLECEVRGQIGKGQKGTF